MTPTLHTNVAADRHDAALAAVPAQQPARQPSTAPAECGSGWYHDAAIKASQQAPARKH